MGFTSLRYTQTPNEIFDYWLSRLSGAELKVLLAIVRSTLGYHQDSVTFSISDIEGMTRLSRNSIVNAAKKLEALTLVERTERRNGKEAAWKLVFEACKPSKIEDVSRANPQKLRVKPSKIDGPLNRNLTKQKLKENLSDDVSQKLDLEHLVDGILHFAQEAERQKLGEVEEMLNRIERAFSVNLQRSLANQTIARKILAEEKAGRTFDKFVTWFYSDEWRASHAYIYANLDKLWTIYPQAFDDTNRRKGADYGNSETGYF